MSAKEDTDLFEQVRSIKYKINKIEKQLARYLPYLERLDEILEVLKETQKDTHKKKLGYT